MEKRIFFLVIVSLAFGILLGGCASRHERNRTTAPLNGPGQGMSDPAGNHSLDGALGFFDEEFEEDKSQVEDPLIVWNRLMYHVNDRLYFYMVKPASQLYGHVVHEFLRSCIKNFFHNLTTPVRLTNCLLQGKLDAAGAEIGRFCLNTTVGILGLGNPARKYPDMNPSDEDFGQTLATYGVTNGFYIFWPLLGPSTLRDSVGMFGDRFVSPLAYVEPFEASVAISVFEMLNSASFRIGEYEDLKEAAIEPYIVIRDGYIQLRKQQVAH